MNCVQNNLMKSARPDVFMVNDILINKAASIVLLPIVENIINKHLDDFINFSSKLLKHNHSS